MDSIYTNSNTLAMRSSTCSNPQDLKESTSPENKEPAEMEYAEGVDDLTIEFLKTRYRNTLLVSLGSLIVDEDAPEYSDSFLNRLDSAHIDLEGKEEGQREKGSRDKEKNANYESIVKDEKVWCEEDSLLNGLNSVDIDLNGKEEGKTEKGGETPKRGNYESIAKDEKEWWEEEIMTDSAAVVVVGFFGGFLGYLLYMRWDR